MEIFQKKRHIYGNFSEKMQTWNFFRKNSIYMDIFQRKRHICGKFSEQNAYIWNFFSKKNIHIYGINSEKKTKKKLNFLFWNICIITEFFPKRFFFPPPKHYVKSYLNCIGASMCLQSIAQLFLCLV